MRQMSGVGDHGQRRAGDEAVERLGIGRRDDAVLPSPDHVGRNVHAMQPALEPRIEEARLPAEARACDAVEDGLVLILVGGRALGGGLAEPGIGIGKTRLLLRIDHEDVGLGNAFDMDAGRRDQGQAAQPVGRAHRHFQRDPAAERLADHVNPREPERLDEVEIEVGDVGNVVDPGGQLRAVEAGVIGHDHVELFRQRIEQRRPFAEPVGAVQVHERLAAPAAPDAQLAAADRNLACRERHRRPTYARTLHRTGG